MLNEIKKTLSLKMNTVKKGRILEAFIAIIEDSIDDGNIITLEKNKSIKSDIGLEREIDIYIEMKINNRILKYVIECKNYDNPVKVGEIDAFISKCEQVRADKKIYVTSSHYQSGAITLANSKGIDLCILELDDSLSLNSDFDIKEVDVFSKSIKIIHKKVVIDEKGKETALDNPKIVNSTKRLITNTMLEESIGASIWKSLLELLVTKQGLILNHKKTISFQINCSGIQLKHNKQWSQVKNIHLLADIQMIYKKIDTGEGRKYRSITDNIILASLISTNIELEGHLMNISFVKGNDKNKFVVSSDKIGSIKYDISQGSIHNLEMVSNPIEKIQYENLLDVIPTQTISYNLADSALKSVESNLANEEQSKVFDRNLSEGTILVSVNPNLKLMQFVSI